MARRPTDPKDARRKARRRTFYRAYGLCRCGVEPPREGFKSCKHCALLNSASCARAYLKRKGKRGTMRSC